jgi:hypothetical protein
MLSLSQARIQGINSQVARQHVSLLAYGMG